MLLLLLPLLLFLGYLLLNLQVYLERRKYRHLPMPSFHPSSPPIWFLGALPDVKRRLGINPNKSLPDVLMDYHKETGWDLFHVPFPRKNMVFCIHLPIVREVLMNRSAFNKLPVVNEVMDTIAGTRCLGNVGLLNEPGTHVWATKRRIMDPAFHRSFMRNTLTGMNQVVKKLTDNLHEAQGTVVDISAHFNRAGFEIIAICGFSWDLEQIEKETENQLEMITVMLSTMTLAMKDRLFFDLPWKYKEQKALLRRVVTASRDLVRNHLEERMDHENQDEQHDILSYIIKANTFSDQLTIENIVDDYLVFMAAGMETTAITMACTIFYLLRNKGAYLQVQQEVDDVFGDKKVLEFEDLPKLSYLEAVIKETLRLNPPVVSTARECIADNVVLDGIHIPHGAGILIHQAILHKDARYWKSPDTFNPDHFTAPNRSKIKQFTYMPFNAGPRNCIGKNFAIMEMKLVLSMLLKEFEIKNPNPEVTKLITVTKSITARPIEPIKVMFLPRQIKDCKYHCN